MLDVFNIAQPPNCNIQIFYGDGVISNSIYTKAWTKPRGVSNVYMLLIGPGGNGDGSTGGGSGAVTVWYGTAQNVPDSLILRAGVSSAGSTTEVLYKTANIINSLLTANAASGLTAGTAMTANQFCASGFFQSIAGQNGGSGSVSASTTTFLSGGGAGSASTQTSNYGYSVGASGSRNGFLQMQPIIVGACGMGTGAGGIGCGGGNISGSIGGPGMVLIASW